MPFTDVLSEVLVARTLTAVGVFWKDRIYVGRIYENGSLYADVLHHDAELKREEAERKRAQQAQRESEEQVPCWT